MLKRHRMTTAITGILGGALLITGCGAVASQSSLAPEGNAGAGIASGGGGGDIGTSNCSEADFIASASPSQGDPNSFIVSFGNRSAKTCTINGGVPNVKGLDMGGAPIEDLPVEDVRIPDAPKQFTLQPGQTVSYLIGMIPAGTDLGGHAITGFQSSLPDMSELQTVNVVGGGDMEYGVKGLRVSSLMPPEELNPA